MFSRRSNPYYPDVPFFLVAIPFISAFNYYLTYPNIRFNSYLLLTFTIDTATGYVAVWGVRRLILYIDRIMPYEGRVIRRIVVQVITTTALGLLIISALTELTSFVARGRGAIPEFYTFDLLIISIWFFAINGFYIVMHFYREWKQIRQSSESEEQLIREGLVVRSGTKDIRLSFEDVIVLTVEGEYTKVLGSSSKSYLLYESLSVLEKKLPERFFFRLNRQTIIHRQVIAGYKRLDHGKLEVMLKSSVADMLTVTVSRDKAASFRRWFLPH